MTITRRHLLQSSALAGGALALPGALAFAPVARGTIAVDAPQTGFERTGDWTTHDDELALLDQIAQEAVNPLTIEVVGETAQGRPLHLVTIGLGVSEEHEPRTMPTTMILGSQHGNEPAGREAALIFIRDLAYADLTDAANARTAAVLAEQTILVVPTANPDGREANRRTNSKNFDINRDHLTLVTEEAQVFAGISLEWEPQVALDLHEYGPTTPVLYDDDLLYLWPRNLNVDTQVHDIAKEFCIDYIKADSEAAGYTADEYGLRKVGPNIGPVPTEVEFTQSQTAGGPDEGICRNAMGLRHSMGILVESATSSQPYRPEETMSGADLRRRRVASQRVVLDALLRFLEERGEEAKTISDGARVRKATEGAERSAPLYFDGADNEASTNFVDPPPSGYRLTPAQLADEEIASAIEGHGIAVDEDGTVSMAQHAEPVIGLLLDGRGSRSITAAEALD